MTCELAPAAAATVSPDPATWQAVPADDPGSRWTWDVLVRLLVLRSDADPVLLHAQLLQAREAAARQDEDRLFVALLPSTTVLVAGLTVREALPGRSDYLLDVADARRHGALDPPVVEHLPADGLSVLRYDELDGVVIGTRTMVRRSAGCDVVLTASSPDLAGIAQLEDPMRALLAAVAVAVAVAVDVDVAVDLAGPGGDGR